MPLKTFHLNKRRAAPAQATKTMNDKITDFGFEKVPEDQKARKVAEVFDSVAAKYDIMNDLRVGR